ncbi:transposase [Streptomyces sp. NBC_01210]|uniref:transposase n=1 Tax=Streptomyces sp. NBC_01210 TaxID=2903774 RepID=UPI002E14A9ED|nr:transposase [Streptomyces sp. NBC_01210]
MAGGPGPQPEGYCRRQTLDVICDHVDNGVKWHALPADFSTWDRVCAFFRRWLRHGLRAGFPIGCAAGCDTLRTDQRSLQPP